MSSHILPLPKAVFGVKIAQLVLALIVLGLASYGATYYTEFDNDGNGIMIFTALATMIITVYYIVSITALPVIYNYWAILGLDIFSIVFWLVSFSLEAARLAKWFFGDYTSSYDSYTYSGGCILFCKRNLFAKRENVDTDFYTYRGSQAAACGLGGLEFVLFIITLVITSIYLHKHRTAGGHCTPGQTGPVTHEQKDVELQSQPGAYAPPQQYYAPQQVPA